MNNFVRLFRLYVPAILLILYCVYHSVGAVRNARRDYLIGADLDPVKVFDKRLEPLKAGLSKLEYRRVGYITDVPEVADWFTEYFQTQYTLAPIIVDNSTDRSLVVANLHDPSSVEHIMRERSLVVVENYGNGVFLLSGKSQ